MKSSKNTRTTIIHINRANTKHCSSKNMHPHLISEILYNLVCFDVWEKIVNVGCLAHTAFISDLATALINKYTFVWLQSYFIQQIYNSKYYKCINSRILFFFITGKSQRLNGASESSKPTLFNLLVFYARKNMSEIISIVDNPLTINIPERTL